VTRSSVANAAPRPEPRWRAEGWHPLLASKIYSAGDRLQITGDLADQFQELYLPGGETLDPDGPIFMRAQAGKPDIFDVTFLRSDRFGVRGFLRVHQGLACKQQTASEVPHDKSMG
jgi:hypothetical protein